MITLLTIVTLVLALAIVAAVAWHLVGIYVALKRAGDHLEALAGGLTAVRDHTMPLNGKVDAINAGLAALLPPLGSTAASLGNIASALKRV
jgi:hypothetical protein